MKKLIFLVGFMGVGKTYLGQQLAQQLYYDFLDTDQLIEAQQNQSIPTIFTKHGESVFRDYERQVTHELLNRERLVVATGGGLPCHHNLMATLCQNGTTIYLEASVDMIAERLANAPGDRPLINKKNTCSQLEIMTNLMTARAPIYEKADYIFYLSGNKREDERDFLAMCRAES